LHENSTVINHTTIHVQKSYLQFQLEKCRSTPSLIIPGTKVINYSVCTTLARCYGVLRLCVRQAARQTAMACVGTYFCVCTYFSAVLYSISRKYRNILLVIFYKQLPYSQRYLFIQR